MSMQRRVVGIARIDPVKLIDRVIRVDRTSHVGKPSRFCEDRPEG